MKYEDKPGWVAQETIDTLRKQIIAEMAKSRAYREMLATIIDVYDSAPTQAPHALVTAIEGVRYLMAQK